MMRARIASSVRGGRGWLYLLPIGSLLAFASGCGSSSPSSSSGQSVIKIGVIEPLTGVNAESGAEEIQGMKFGANTVNSQGGIAALGHAKIDLVISDDQSTPEKAISAADTLVQQDHVVAILGAYTSGETIPLAAEMDRLQVPLVATTPTSDKLTDSGYTYVVRVGPEASQGAQDMYEFIQTGALQKAGYPAIHNVALLYENGAFGSAFAAAWHKYLPSGMNIVADVPFTTGSPTLVTEMTKIKAANPDIVLFGGYADDGVLVTREAIQLGMTNIPYLDASGAVPDPAFLKGIGSQGNGWFTIDSWNPNLPNQATLSAAFKKATGLEMNGDNAYNYEGVLVLRDALNTAKSTDPKVLNSTLHHLVIPASSPNNALPSNGTIQFDPATGQNIGAKFVVEEIENQGFGLLWPADVAPVEKIAI